MSEAHTAFILAAGFGTRLRPLTLHRPKPLLPVCGVPMLDHALAHVQAHGHSKVLVNAHYLWEQVSAWAVQRGVGLQVELPEILGTGGGLKAAAGRMAERFAIVNADILSDVDLTALDAACPSGGAAMALRVVPEGEHIPPTLADETGEVVRISDKVPGPGGVPGTHFTGVHILSRSALDVMPATGEQCIMRTSYKALVHAHLVGSLRHDGLWFDVGTPAAYLAANLELLAGRMTAPVDPWTRGQRGPGGSWIGPGARVDGVVRGSVVGDGAVVDAGATLDGCVVWDGERVPAGSWRRTVFFGGGAHLTVA